ncbi:uncharacterized protein LOC129871591 [Solanum dulcamara]|uniref:uncharacterized protein LOC129871591 n=1 Tax=Solanum dulcamara TaxID=45834 RepID=UPI002485ECBE|nr:uncharacterized protein LOC129871591 [Solanum dulcamara]
MNSNEMKIRGELEMDVERDLEDEIKEGMCRLALRLHRLYKHQEERNTKNSIDDHGTRDNTRGTNTKALSEVNINIKMEGGTKIEIKEIKKEARHRSSYKASSKVQRMVSTRPPKFDWTQSLRSGSTPVTGYDKIDTFRKKVGQQNVKVVESTEKKSTKGLK